MTKIQKRDTKALKKALIGKTIVDIEDVYEKGLLALHLDNKTILVINTTMFGLTEKKK